MTGIHYIGVEIGLHGTNLPEMDGLLERQLSDAIRAAFPGFFDHESDVTVTFTESARDGT